MPRPPRHLLAWRLPGLLSASGHVLETHRSISLPPEPSPPPLSPVPPTPVQIAGARRRAHATNDDESLHRAVPRVTHRALPQPAEDGEEGASIASEFELEPPPKPKEIDVDFVAVEPPQPSPPPPLSSW